MSPAKGKLAIIISRIPLMQSGLSGVMKAHFPKYEVDLSRSQNELTLQQLNRASVVISDISGEYVNSRESLEDYYLLLSQYREIHWIFLVSRPLYSLAVELLVRPESTLLSDMEPLEGVINAIQAGSEYSDRISQTLLSPEPRSDEVAFKITTMLTLSERKVLRLLGKGWGINQIATLLRKSNKTVSAQKNSAMRRLALHGNAELYAWINSTQGMRELNLISAYGEQKVWKQMPQEEILLS